jgi:hypothetical protein
VRWWYKAGCKFLTLNIWDMYRGVSLSLSLSSCFPPLWSIGHPWNDLFHFSFLILRQSVGLLGRGISPSQGSYLYKHRINTDICTCLEWDSNPRSQRSSGRRQFMPYTTRPLWVRGYDIRQTPKRKNDCHMGCKPCNLLYRRWRFGETCCLDLQNREIWARCIQFSPYKR